MADLPPTMKASEEPTEGSLDTMEPIDQFDVGDPDTVEAGQGGETTVWLGSLIFHLVLLLTLGLIPLRIATNDEAVVIVSPPVEREVEIRKIEQVVYSDTPQEDVGAESLAGSAMAEAAAIEFQEFSVTPNLVDVEPTDFGQIMVNKILQPEVAPMERLDRQKGKVGQGTRGAAGAVDRITFEILKSLEERRTLVVWLFDKSGSLHRQRQEIQDRFDRIYEELGIYQRANQTEPAAKSSRERDRELAEAPLLTSIIGFGSDVTVLTRDPTDDLEELKTAVESIEVDSSGVEMAFTAVKKAADRFRSYRRTRGSEGPERNVLFVMVTDERGDDFGLLEEAVTACRRWAIPVYVVGVPAPFGREHTFVKYVDPDPNFDQSPRWAEVDQGPETLSLERVHVGFTGEFETEPVIDSGFGPYALTRLCYETGGMYFSVHPNRSVDRRVRRWEVSEYASDLRYFFDPDVMSRYRPDYLSPKDYLRQVSASPLRKALVAAAQERPAVGISRPRRRFVRREEAQLVRELTQAQQDAAKLEPRLNRMSQILEPGLAVRDEEVVPRWQAGFDLAAGRVLAQKVRTETYNAMLAKAKRGMPFQNPQNNTWVLEASDEVTSGSRWKNQAALATELLKSVVENHDGTPWALLAEQELEVPIGWKWTEDYTDLSPPAQNNPGNNNPPRRQQNDRARMIPKAPTRPVPRL